MGGNAMGKEAGGVGGADPARSRWGASGLWCWRGLLLLVVVAGLGRLRFDTEIFGLLPPDLPAARGLRLYQQHFTDARQLVVTLEAPEGDPEQVATVARHLAGVFLARTDLVESADWQPPWLEEPGSMAEFLGYLWLCAPTNRVSARVSELMDGDARRGVLDEARQRLATSLSPEELIATGRDPFGFSRVPSANSDVGDSGLGGLGSVGQGGEFFASADGRFRVVLVEARPLLDSYPACVAWLGSMRGLIDAERAAGRIGAGVRIRLTGRPVFVTEIAGGMERDMTGSMSGTLATIALLFWLTHRRLRPMAWLLVILVVIQALTLAFAGLGMGRINVVSLGFAAILFGLAEDFGIVIYQESRAHPGLAIGELRRRVVPGIAWSAITTAGAFLLLNLSGLPGLAQLGTLVAIGVAVAAVAMLVLYLPRVHPLAQADAAVPVPRFALFASHRLVPVPVLRGATVLLGVGAVLVVSILGMRFDRSPQAMGPRQSEARAALENVRQRLGGGGDPLWVIVGGANEAEVAGRLETVDRVLAAAQTRGEIGGYRLPTDAWPRPDRMAANRAGLSRLIADREALRRALAMAGFAGPAWQLADGLLETWAAAEEAGDDWKPRGRVSRWVLRQVLAGGGPAGPPWALGVVQGAVGGGGGAQGWVREVEAVAPDVSVAGWTLLGDGVFARTLIDLPRVLIPVLVTLVVSLVCAFRSWRQLLLSLITLGYAGLVLAAVMRVAGVDWNLMNLMAIPLMLGMGVDFCIHMQLALRQARGNRREVATSVGRALLLAGTTTVAGFASLAFSTNAGLASLGLVCALGILSCMIAAIGLLPAWWSVFSGTKGLDKGGSG